MPDGRWKAPLRGALDRLAGAIDTVTEAVGAELPGLESVYEAKHADGFTIVGVSMDQVSRAQVASFLREHGIQYPIAVATPDVVAAICAAVSASACFTRPIR